MVARSRDERVAGTAPTARLDRDVSLEIKVGPPQLVIHQGHAVRLSELDSQIDWPSENGLYFYDTRVVNCEVSSASMGDCTYARVASS